MSPLDKASLDKLFCLNAKKYNLKKFLLKAVAITESSLNETSYRFEPGFFERYLRNHPDWKDKDPSVVSASYGLGQILFTTAWGLGFRGEAEELYNPVYNIELMAKLIRKLLDQVIEAKFCEKFFWLSPIEIVLARYNGGKRGNPDDKGNLRNEKYVKRVIAKWDELCEKEKDCTE